MSHRWTGGQVSVIRAFIGVTTFARLVAALVVVIGWGAPATTWVLPGTDLHLDDALPLGVAIALVAVGIGLAAAVTLGVARRVCAVLLAFVWLILHGADIVGTPASLPTIEAVLILLALLPPAPFGSFAARGRLDPDGGWRMPDWWFGLAWSVFVGTYAAVALDGIFGTDDPSPSSAILLVLLSGVFSKRVQPFAWLALILFDVIWWASTGEDPSRGAFWLHALTFTPAWIEGPASGTTRVFYDGSCGLCHRSVRFLLAEDRDERFRYAPLGGPTFESRVPEDARVGLPDSLVIDTPGGRILVRSAGIVYTLGVLGGLWGLIGGFARVIPPPFRNIAYDAVARVRKRLFATPSDACPVLPEDLRARFDP